MYMYPINIVREPKKVGYTKEFKLGDIQLTLRLLGKYVSDDETFEILKTEGRDSETILFVYGKRMETDDEVKARVTKEENYMAAYDKFHNKK